MIENLVIGGGLAGASMAARLAAAGRTVTLLERETGPHGKVCGEFLSWEAVAYLEALGVSPTALGAAAVGEVRLFHGRRTASAPLPFPALSLSRRVLDEALLGRAAEFGATILRGTRVTAVTQADGHWTIQAGAAAATAARAVFLASGKHDVRGLRRPPGLQSDLVGFKMPWRLAPAQAAALNGAVELHLFPGGYAGLEPVEGGAANLCLVIRKAALHDSGGGWAGVLARTCGAGSALAQRLDGAEPLLDRPLAISAIPYGYVRRESDGLWRLGDQAAVIPSFAGEGMSIALHSAALAAEHRLGGGSAESFQRRLASDVGPQVRGATLLSQMLVRGWGQSTASTVGAALPRLLPLVALGTRLPKGAVPVRPPALRLEAA